VGKRKQTIFKKRWFDITRWGGGPVLNQHVWDGQALKDPCFLILNQHVWDGQGFKRSLLFQNFFLE
jgi:hypothetical protein